jgi:hypothetical protein
LEPNQPRAHAQLAYVYGNTAIYLETQMKSRREVVELSLASGQRAVALDPQHIEVYSSLAQGYQMLSHVEDEQGGDPRPAIAKGMEWAKKLAQQTPNGYGALHTLGLLAGDLAQWKLAHGIEAMDDLRQSADYFEQVIARAPTLNLGHAGACAIYEVLAAHEARVGRDPRASFDKAAGFCKKTAELDPSDATGPHNLGCVYADLANWQLGRGEDPSHTIELARHAFQQALKLMPSSVMYGMLGIVAITEARWRTQRNEDPTAAFAVAESELKRAQAMAPEDAQNPKDLARVMRWRAVWAEQRHQPVDTWVRAGLEQTAKAEKLNHELADTFVTEAELHVLALHAARDGAAKVAAAQKARAALDRAVAIDATLKSENQALLDEVGRVLQ